MYAYVIECIFEVCSVGDKNPPICRHATPDVYTGILPEGL